MFTTIHYVTALLQLVSTTALSAYALTLSYENITRLRHYEEKSEKAAEWSNTAAHKLHKTRTTQASGTVTLILSLLTSTALIFLPSYATPRAIITASAVNAAALYASRTHMARFWNESKQAKVPFVDKFNEAIRGSEKVVLLLGTLSQAWAVTGMVWFGMANGGSVLLGLATWGLAVGGRVVYIAADMGWMPSAPPAGQ
ncbi:hypothetical protein BDW02DRAFT_322286 [Decorospora gaudefroyi]|uniref:Uncharacterized protein n=1 Tax=Decorospora gaudefroyi TaxID=184978 RepID=A0A6A5KBS6_9PLEO|nr:hypothetical protein BDW02DRAFT_322286 [Decorospora gaudefroyi]